MSRHVYDHGLPFSKDLGDNLDDLDMRIEKKKAALLVVDGGVGEGKTTISVEAAEYFQKGPINFDEQLAMGGKDFLHKMRICFQKKLKVIIYDEAGDFNRRGSLTRFNAMLNRTFETYRAFKILVILVLPNFGVLDEDIFDKKIPRLLLHCENRGDDYGNFKAYSLWKMYYIRNAMKKLVVKSSAFDFETPNFQGHFLDLTPERSRELDRFSTKGKMKELQSAEVKIEGLVSYQDIATKCVRSVIWVKKAVAELKIKPARTIDRRSYFDEGIIDVLMDYIDEKSMSADKGEKRERIRVET